MQLSSPTSPLFSLSACSPWSARSLFSTSSHLKSLLTNFPQITFYILQGLFYSTIPYSAFQVFSIDERCYWIFLNFCWFPGASSDLVSLTPGPCCPPDLWWQRWLVRTCYFCVRDPRCKTQYQCFLGILVGMRTKICCGPWSFLKQRREKLCEKTETFLDIITPGYFGSNWILLTFFCENGLGKRLGWLSELAA